MKTTTSEPPLRESRSGLYPVGRYHQFDVEEQRLVDAALDKTAQDLRDHYDKERAWRERPTSPRSHQSSVFWIAADAFVDCVSTIRVPFDRASWNAETSRIANQESMGIDKTSQWQS